MNGKIGTRQLFMAFNITHDFIRTAPYSMSIEFGMQEKIVTLIKMHQTADRGGANI
jgi:hypothetical protein